MQVIINGITGFNNRGVEAFTVPTIDCVREHWSDACITIHSMSPAKDREQLNATTVDIEEDSLARGLGILISKCGPLGHLAPRRIIGNVTSAQRALKRSDLVIALGGDIFSSDYGASNKHLYPMQYAKQHGAKTVFLAHSIGPFANVAELEQFKAVASNSDLVTVRESLTYRYAVEQLQLPERIVHQTADPAFLLQPPPDETINAIMTNHGVDLEREIVALSISGSISSYTDSPDDAHEETWLALIRHLLAEGLQVALIPHVHGPDTNIAVRLMRKLQWPKNVFLFAAGFSASEYKGIISHCQLLIAERMHAAIAGLGSGVCTMPVAYSVKAPGIVGDLLGSDAVSSGVVVDFQQFLGPKTAKAHFNRMWGQRQSVANALAANLDAYRGRSTENYHRLFGLFE